MGGLALPEGACVWGISWASLGSTPRPTMICSVIWVSPQWGPGAGVSMAAICHRTQGCCRTGHRPREPHGVLPVRRCSGCCRLPWRQGGQGPGEPLAC